MDDPKNWNVQTRCADWEVRDMVEMAYFKFTPPAGHTLADMLGLRLEAGEYAIGDKHLADAPANLSERPEPGRVPVPAT